MLNFFVVVVHFSLTLIGDKSNLIFDRLSDVPFRCDSIGFGASFYSILVMTIDSNELMPCLIPNQHSAPFNSVLKCSNEFCAILIGNYCDCADFNCTFRCTSCT